MNTDARYEYEYVNIHGYELIETGKKEQKGNQTKKTHSLTKCRCVADNLVLVGVTNQY